MKETKEITVKKKDIGVSVIVPVYNAKTYIRSCIEGLLKQTLQGLEIVIVDDCSEDGSYDICLELAERYDGIKLLRQDVNSGPGRARNMGIRAASGEYITFMDSDDAILPDALERLYDIACEYRADVVHTTGCLIPVADPIPDDLFSVNEKDLVPFDQDTDPPSQIRVLPDDLNERFQGMLKHRYQGNVWGKLFKRSFITEHEIIFGDCRLSEDQIFCFACLMQATVYVQIPARYNIYRIGGVSLSRGPKNNAYFIKILRSLFEASECLEKCMEGIAWFDGKDDECERMQMYLVNGMEELYIRPAYTRMDTDSLKRDEGMKQLFKEFFGSRAAWVQQQFYSLHDAQSELPDILGEMNDPQYWKRMKREDKYGSKT